MIKWAKNKKFVIVVQDESIFSVAGKNGKKLWSRVGDPIIMTKSSKKSKIIVYGSITGNKTRLIRCYPKFDVV